MEEADKAPFGTKEIVEAPWGEMVDAHTYKMPDWSGKTVKYCVVSKPKGNPGVRVSVFKHR